MKFIAPLILAAALGLAAPALAQTTPPVAATAPALEPAAAFLAKNAIAAGVKTLPSGLQYKVITAGPAGPSPKIGDAIKVHYEGALTNGAVFDSSFQRNKPLMAPLEDLVPGWMEALPLMHVGDEWMLYVPPVMGYGSEGAGPIPPDSVLVFRIKLLGMLSAD
jgi:FKBP-type peptidyl-prolyl cis-trans isomerase FklB